MKLSANAVHPIVVAESSRIRYSYFQMWLSPHISLHVRVRNECNIVSSNIVPGATANDAQVHRIMSNRPARARIHLMVHGCEHSTSELFKCNLIIFSLPAYQPLPQINFVPTTLSYHVSFYQQSHFKCYKFRNNNLPIAII